MAADVASVQFSRTAKRLHADRSRVPPRAAAKRSGRAARQGHARSGGRRSLKTQQHAGVVWRPESTGLAK